MLVRAAKSMALKTGKKRLSSTSPTDIPSEHRAVRAFTRALLQVYYAFVLELGALPGGKTLRSMQDTEMQLALIDKIINFAGPPYLPAYLHGRMQDRYFRRVLFVEAEIVGRSNGIDPDYILDIAEKALHNQVLRQFRYDRGNKMIHALRKQRR